MKRAIQPFVSMHSFYVNRSAADATAAVISMGSARGTFFRYEQKDGQNYLHPVYNWLEKRTHVKIKVEVTPVQQQKSQITLHFMLTDWTRYLMFGGFIAQWIIFGLTFIIPDIHDGRWIFFCMPFLVYLFSFAAFSTETQGCLTEIKQLFAEK